MKRVLIGLGLTLSLVHLACSPANPVASSIELDHVYMYPSARSPEWAVVGALEQIGLRVQQQRNDFGDGVLGRYIRFDNAYLELLWYDGVTPTDEDTRQRATWEESGASPFGIGFRRQRGVEDPLPFPSRPYVPEWMKKGEEFRQLNPEGNYKVPDLFVVPPSMAYRAQGGGHRLGIRRLTGVRITVPSGGLSDGARLVNESGLAELAVGPPSVVLTFDNGAKKGSADLRPLLPMTILY